ncbi:YciE/YciF ferroxidase family protein [Epilithonimonas vandammei]|uniref:YciE/YciF ferroxidase family protein n=1 Tax=Epilithonimonas vandammei TaxID=2487072 RepID=UPI0028ACF548|nr:ferritin-like domain-containing protein [Epilithonimonas vandammei]
MAKKETETEKKTETAEKKTKTAEKKATGSKKSEKVQPKSDAAEKLRDFFVDGLKDLLWAEQALVKNLPKMEKNATAPELKKAVADHLEQTKGQVERLKEVFSILGEKAEAVKCDAMDGLLKEAEGILEETEPGAVRDAAIIAAAQKVEHYEIASYGTLATYAKLLDETKAGAFLYATLEEEKQCDSDLTVLAETKINIEAE